jgi:hypothetical protein
MFEFHHTQIFETHFSTSAKIPWHWFDEEDVKYLQTLAESSQSTQNVVAT